MSRFSRIIQQKHVFNCFHKDYFLLQKRSRCKVPGVMSVDYVTFPKTATATNQEVMGVCGEMFSSETAV